jgi:predicted DNA binding CopG/RHH family protein
MPNNNKNIPKFNSIKAENEFWQQHDSSEFIDWSQAQQVDMPNLKPSLKSISIRLPESMLVDIKTLANKRDVPYQSLMKMFLNEKINKELGRI